MQLFLPSPLHPSPSTPRFRHPRPNGHTSALWRDTIYVIGGSDCPDSMEAFDTKTQQWSCMHNTPSRCRASASCCLEGVIYVYGGHGELDLDTKIASHNRLCMFDCKTGAWLPSSDCRSKPHCKRSYHTLTECNGVLVAIGGINGFRSISDTEYLARIAVQNNSATIKHPQTKPHVDVYPDPAATRASLGDTVLSVQSAPGYAATIIHHQLATSHIPVSSSDPAPSAAAAGAVSLKDRLAASKRP